MLVTEGKNQQYRVTLPKQLCLAMGIEKGTKVKFEINKKGNLELIKE